MITVDDDREGDCYDCIKGTSLGAIWRSKWSRREALRLQGMTAGVRKINTLAGKSRGLPDGCAYFQGDLTGFVYLDTLVTKYLPRQLDFSPQFVTLQHSTPSHPHDGSVLVDRGHCCHGIALGLGGRCPVLLGRDQSILTQDRLGIQS